MANRGGIFVFRLHGWFLQSHSALPACIFERKASAAPVVDRRVRRLPIFTRRRKVAAEKYNGCVMKALVRQVSWPQNPAF